MRQGKDMKREKDVQRAPKQELGKPKLKDLNADPDKTDKVRAGGANCRVPGGC